MSNICRICLEQKKGMLSIYKKLSNKYDEPIFSMIMYCASVKIEKGDGLPESLCKFCKTRLETAYLFKRDCERSESKLRETIKGNCNQVKIENSQSQTSNDHFSVVLLKVNPETDTYYYENNNIKTEEPTDQDTGPIEDYLQTDDNSFSTTGLKQEWNTAQPDASFKIATVHSVYKQEESDHRNDSDDEKFHPVDDELMSKKSPKKRNNLNKSNDGTSRFRRYICYKCSSIFYTDEEFMRHEYENHRNLKYICDFENCNQEFFAYLKYAAHCKTDHYVENCLVCQKCHNSYRRKKNLDRHILSKHCDRTQECSHCSKRFQDTRALELHMNIHMEKYECKVCKKCFSTALGLENHKRIHPSENLKVCSNEDLNIHSNKSLDIHSNENLNVSPNDDLNMFVKEDINTPTNEDLHIPPNEDSNILPNEDSNNQSDDDSKVQSNDDDSNVCHKCNKKFNNQLFFKRHRCIPSIKVSGEKKKWIRKKVKNYLCSCCGRTFLRPMDLTVHMRTHTGIKPFSCDQCEYRCHKKKLLQDHMRKHSNERPYKCSYCAKGFNARGYLTIHERFHSGYRPYICRECNKGFTNSKDLKVHERTHTGIKLFSCEFCGNSFTTLHYLRVHTQKHGNGV